MTRNDALFALEPKMDKYLDEIKGLVSAVVRINPNPKSYSQGILDGVENTTLIAFRAGAKAMYDLLTNKNNGKSDNI